MHHHVVRNQVSKISAKIWMSLSVVGYGNPDRTILFSLQNIWSYDQHKEGC